MKVWQFHRESVAIRPEYTCGNCHKDTDTTHPSLGMNNKFGSWRTRLLVNLWTKWLSNNTMCSVMEELRNEGRDTNLIENIKNLKATQTFVLTWRFFPWLNITCLIKYIYKSQSYWLGWSKDPGPPKAGMFPAIFIVGDASCGQIELTKILSSVFNAMLPKIEFRKVLPSEFKLFQVADLLCSFCLIDLKLSHGCCLSHSELTFFGNLRD